MTSPIVHIVIVDDSPADANLLKRYISKIHFWKTDICIFESPNAFFDYKNLHKVDIVFVDYLLGKRNGIDLIKKTKQKLPELSFVLLTGFGNEEIIKQALRVGASDYINKAELSHDIVEKTIRHLVTQKENNQKLQFTQNMLQTVIDKTETALTITDEKGFVLEFNEVFLNIIETKNTKLVNRRHISDWAIPESQSILNKAIQQCTTTKSINNLELAIQTSTHKEKYLLFNGVKIEDSDKNQIYLMIRDISSQKRYEQELKFAKIKAEEADRLKSAFLANLSHEIRTPLNAITGFSSIIVDENISKEQQKECATHIKDGSETLLNLINDIIEVSQIVARQIKVTKSDCYVNTILDDLFLSFSQKRDISEKQDIEISIKKSNPLANFKISSDPFRLKQVLNNLLDNALKFTEKGAIEFGYSIKENKFIEFFVQDTGIGISEEKLSVIFDWFRKASDTNEKFYRGSGIGLTICYSLVGLLGGELKVKSETGKGSLFWFKLPIELTNDSLKIAPLKNNQSSKIKNFSGKTILIAEDEDTNFHFLKIALLKNNFRILRAKTGKEAIEIVQKENVDAILMDIKMPVLDGYEATKAIKSLKPNLPIIAQTAYAMHNDKAKILEAGCDDYISKPITINSLISVLEKIFQFET